MADPDHLYSYKRISLTLQLRLARLHADFSAFWLCMYILYMRKRIQLSPVLEAAPCTLHLTED